MTGPVTGPIVRVELELGDYRPVVDAEDDDWRPITYAVVAHHATELSADALSVRERRLERLTLRYENAYDDELEGPKRVELELPATVGGLEALAQLIDHARDYLAQEARP